jgi:hypothetical protein
VITTTRLVDNVRVDKTTIPHTKPFTSTKTGVTSGVSTVTKPTTETRYKTVTKTKTKYGHVTTHVPVTTSSLCTVSKPWTSQTVSVSKCGPGGYGW